MLKKIIFALLSLVATGLTFMSCAESTAPENTAPICNITNPTANTTLTAGDNIIIYGYATDNDGLINEVKFYIDTDLKKTDYLYPYTYEWNTAGLTEGAHSIKVTATDDAGLSTTDNITVNI